MLKYIFGSCPQVKVIDYLLAHPFDDYTKQQIAVGSEISRSTLDNFINDLLKNELIILNNDHKYELNRKSSIVKMIDNVQNEMANDEMDKQVETFDEDIINYSDEEIDNMFETDVPDIDLDEAEREIEEKILITEKGHDFHKLIISIPTNSSIVSTYDSYECRLAFSK